MTDLIDRQAAIDAVGSMLRRKFGIGGDLAEITLAGLPSAQPVAKDINVPVKDCISRKAAMEEISKQQTYKMFELEDTLYLDANDVGSVLASLPSAQPEKRTDKRTKTHSCDLISRQATIDAILAVTGNSSVRELYEHVQEHGLSDMWSGGVNAAIDIIIAVPSAQPDMSEYSDKLWKAAYERGKTEAQPDLDEVYAHAETEAEARFHAERKKGKWIEQEDSWDGVYYECSACGEPWTTIDGTPWDNGMNFCPNCGAEMEDEG